MGEKTSGWAAGWLWDGRPYFCFLCVGVAKGVFLGLQLTFGGMASKGLWAMLVSTATDFEADYCASHTIEILIGYTVCCTKSQPGRMG